MHVHARKSVNIVSISNTMHLASVRSYLLIVGIENAGLNSVSNSNKI
jgi:hypothetical protein